MYCKNCGRQIPDQMKVCGYCGTPVEQQQTPAQQTASLPERQRNPVTPKKKNMAVPIALSCLAAALLTGALLFAFREKLFAEKPEASSGHLMEHIHQMPQRPDPGPPAEEEAPSDHRPVETGAGEWAMDPFALPRYVTDHVNVQAAPAAYAGRYSGSTSYEVKGRDALLEILGEEDTESLLALDGTVFDTTAILNSQELQLCFPEVSDRERADWFTVNKLQNGVSGRTEEYADAGFDNYETEQIWFLEDGSLYGYRAQLLFRDGTMVGGMVMRVELLLTSGARESAAQLETREEPDWEEFSWYEQVRVNGIGPNAQLTTDFQNMTGWWKACQIADPDRTQGVYSRELMSLEITGTAAEVEFIMHPYVIYWEDQTSSDSSEWGPYCWSGSYRNGEFYMTGAGNIRLSQVWFLDGREFALGAVTFQDGTTGELALMRP